MLWIIWLWPHSEIFFRKVLHAARDSLIGKHSQEQATEKKESLTSLSVLWISLRCFDPLCILLPAPPITSTLVYTWNIERMAMGHALFLHVLYCVVKMHVQISSSCYNSLAGVYSTLITLCVWLSHLSGYTAQACYFPTSDPKSNYLGMMVA